MTITLRLGRWQDALKDLDQVDAVITDPPYSKRQIAGFRSGSLVDRGERQNVSSAPDRRYAIPYAAWTEADAEELAEWCVGHVRWWVVSFGDHVVWRWLEAAFQAADWWVAAPVGWVKPNPPPRMAADGPATAIEPILVARPRRRLPPERRGSRPGQYTVQVDPVGGAAHGAPRLVGAKPLALMHRVLRDYTCPGDLVVDPCSGSGTTLIAAHDLGRRAIGAELDPETYALARARIGRELGLGELARRRG